MKKRGLIELIAILLGVGLFSGIVYAIVAKVCYQPIDAAIVSCSTQDYVCGNDVCTAIYFDVKFNQTVDDRVFLMDMKFTYAESNSDWKCPTTVTVWRDKMITYYCIDEYSSTCTLPVGLVTLSVFLGIALVIGIPLSLVLALGDRCKKKRDEQVLQVVVPRRDEELIVPGDDVSIVESGPSIAEENRSEKQEHYSR